MAVSLIACKSESYQKNDDRDVNSQAQLASEFNQSTFKPDLKNPYQIPLQIKSVNSVPKVQANTQQIMCMHTDLSNWYAFDDYIEQPKCAEVEEFQIKNYTCSIEDNAFSLGFKAANLTNYNDHRVLAFRTSAQCKEALEIREANRETA